MLNQEDLIKKVKNYNKFLNPETLSKAYTFALKAHKNQTRDSGDPYLSHPVEVANILTDLKLDSATIATGLLHDTIEDTKATYKAVEKSTFTLESLKPHSRHTYEIVSPFFVVNIIFTHLPSLSYQTLVSLSSPVYSKSSA